MNELHKKFKTFEKGLDFYLTQMERQERDCGNCQPPSEEEIKANTEQFKVMWEMENFKLPATNWW